MQIESFALEPVGVNVFLTIPNGFSDSRAFCRTVAEAESVVLAPGNVFGFGLPTDELEEGLARVGWVIENK